MDKVKDTSKADIKKKVKELGDLKAGLEFLLTSHAALAGKLKTTFSNECVECGRNDQFVKNTRDIFIADISKVVNLVNALNDLLTAIVPSRFFPHFDDYNEDGTKPELNETYDPLK